MKKDVKKKKIIELKEKFNPATAKYEPALPLKKGKLKFRLNWNWKTILILLLLIFFLYALFSGWLNFGSLGGGSSQGSGLIRP